MKITLINPCSGNKAMGTLIWSPLGLCRLSRFLENMGHRPTIIEDALNKLPNDRILESVSDQDIVGIGAMTLQSWRAEELIDIIRQQYPNKIIVVGGCHYSAFPVLPKSCDALVVGDAERAFLEIIEGRRGVIEGSFWKEFIPVDLSYLTDFAINYGDHLIDLTPAITVITTRGCPYGCKFCGSPKMFGRRIIEYDLGQVVQNMGELSEKYGRKSFRIFDDTFTLKKDRVNDFCKLVDNKGWRMSCLTNVHTIRQETLKLMKAVGFDFMAIGAESTDPTVLDLARKNQRQDQIERAIEAIHEAGLRAEVLFVIGLPGETPESLQKTIEFAGRLKVFRIHVQFFTPFPGCIFHDEIKAGQHGQIIESDCRKWTHRVPVFVPDTITLEDMMSLAERFFFLAGRTIGS